MQVAQTIIDQLGGIHRLKAMVGVSQLVYSSESVKFSFKGSRKANMCKITLMPSDTYLVQFYKFSTKNLNLNPVKEYNDVYCDQLVEIFEEGSGLFLSL